MKPTFGLVSRTGVIPNCFSLDHCGPLTRTVEDCAIVLQVISAHDARDRSSTPRARPDFRGRLRRDLKGVRVGVVRHFWEEDRPAGRELARATDEALRVMEELGARLETVRLRPVRDYCDVWTLIEAPETFSIQRANLITRAQDFGSVFLERTLIACLIQAADYMDAQRVRGNMVDEMQSIWEKHDVLVTVGAGPAPRLDPALAAWPSLNIFSPFAVLGAPAIVVPAGYSDAGLPMSIQIAGKPFEDANVLGIAHAYEQATQWWLKRKPDLSSFKPPAPIAWNPPRRSLAGVDPGVASLCERAARSAGLQPAEEQLAILCGAAPDLLEMVQRVGRTAGTAEPASIFSFPTAS
jgi:aspartyl-tRNA(Asn)/glutamyl-tRNA(Gln) amidotransferase subunit A